MYNIYTILYSLKKHYSLNIWQFIAQHVYKLSSSNHTWNRWVLCHISTLNRKCNYYLSYFICSSRLAWVEVLWGSTLTPLILKWWNENKKKRESGAPEWRWQTVVVDCYMKRWDGPKRRKKFTFHRRSGENTNKRKPWIDAMPQAEIFNHDNHFTV